MLYWAQSQQALTLGAWWWFIPPGLAVALIGTSLVLLNFGIDEIGNPRLRDAAGAKRRGLSKWSPSDPTPVVRSGGARAAVPGHLGASSSRRGNGGPVGARPKAGSGTGR